MKRHRNSDTKDRQQRTTTVMNYWGLKLILRAQPHPRYLKSGTKQFSWLFGSHDNPLTRQ